MSSYNAIKQIESERKLLTNSKLLAVFFVQLNEAYQISVLLPIVVFMCRDFGISPQWLGVYSSILNASFGFCQFLVSYLWGYLSDIYGRRIILICGLSGTCISMTIFGFSTSFAMAMASRCLTGIFNGNLGVVKAYLADITDSTNRGWAFSIIGVSFGIGIILGSMLGGILIETNDVDLSDDEYIKTRSILKFSIFESQFPFLLPTAICGGLISINSLLWTVIFIKDEIKKKYDDVDNIKSILSIDSIEMTSNLTTNTLKYNKNNNNNNNNDNDEMQKSAMHQSLPTYEEFKAMVSKLEPDKMKLLGNLRESRDVFNDDNIDNNNNNNNINISTASDLFKYTYIGHCLLQYGIAAISFMMFKEMGPVFMAQALLFNSMYIGYSQAFAGGILFVFTLIVQPYCLKTFNHKIICAICAIATFFCTLSMPSIYWFTLIDDDDNKYGFMTHSIWLLMMVCFVEFMITCTVSIVFVVAVCWLNNSVPQHCLGKANGIGQTLAAFVRGFGPLLTGFIWSESFQQIDKKNRSYAVYYAYIPGAILYIITVIDIILYIPSYLQYTWEQRKDEEKMKK